MNFSKKLLCVSLFSCVLAGCGSDNNEDTVKKPDAPQSNSKFVSLEKLNWNAFNYDAINNLLKKYGTSSSSYDKKNKPYVIFDFDNTSIFWDIQEATLAYQIQNLEFKVTPSRLKEIVEMNIPKSNFTSSYQNKNGQDVNIDKVAQDIYESYAWIYQNYIGFNIGKMSLEEIQKTEQYKNFSTKLRYTYSAIGDTFDPAVSYPWVIYLLEGHSKESVQAMVKKTFEWQQKQKIESVKWLSSDVEKGQSGQLETAWKNGLRVQNEMKNLYKTFEENGFDVYVVSASFIDVIEYMATAPEIGFNVPKDHVFAMQFERTADGKIKAEQDLNKFPQTQGPGKTDTINKFIYKKYGYGPIFVAGDSSGDQNMMSDFKDMKLGLIIDRFNVDKVSASPLVLISRQAISEIGSANPRYIIQGRDENTGQIVSGHYSIKLGTKDPAIPNFAK